MKKKQIISILLAAVISAGLLAGCGSQLEPAERNATVQEPAPAVSTTPVPVQGMVPVPETLHSVENILEEYIGHWAGSVGDINLAFSVESNGTGLYTFEQRGYFESYDFTLEAGTETFSVRIPEVNTLGIGKVEGDYVYSDGMLILDVRTTFIDGRVFEYTVPCQRVE